MRTLFYTLILTFITMGVIHSQDLKSDSSNFLFVGTYTSETSEGVYVYEFDPASGKLTYVTTAKDLHNPSFLTISPDRKHIYAVSEAEKEGDVYSLVFDPQKKNLEKLNTETTGGAGGCHVSLDKSGKWALISHYSSGTLAVHPVNSDGTIGKQKQTIIYKGKGVNKDRQEGPHIHSATFSPSNKSVFVADLGTDKIYTYDFNAINGDLKETNPAFISSKPGAGPRHLAIHPNQKYIYVLNELNSTVSAYREKDLKEIQTISTLPENYAGKKWGADIHVSADGNFLYASNRDHESIAVFNIMADGKLKLVEIFNLSGKTPRNFAIDPSGKFILVAYQDSDNIIVYKRDTQTGKLSKTDFKMQVSKPVCLKFIENNK